MTLTGNSARDKESNSTVSTVANCDTRVEVPRRALEFFVQPEVHITTENAAKLLGFAGVDELRKFSTPLLKQFEGSEPLGAVMGANTFNRLIMLCAPKTSAARQLLDDLSSTWRYPKCVDLTVNLPAEPLSSSGSIPRWPSCPPEAAGMDPAPLERVRHYLNWRARMKHFAGISCGVAKAGQVVFYHESGFSDVEAKTKMAGDTIMRLFSMTKCLVAVAFMTYVEDPTYNVDLDDPVSKYIPAFAVNLLSVLPKKGKENQPCERPITLRQLITHTSGIGYGATLDDPWPPTKDSYYKIYEELCESTRNGVTTTLEQWCNMLAKIPLKGQPGRFWDYSYSVDVLGRVLEIISGKTLDVVVEEKVCGPLKMRDTTFVVPPEKASRIGPWYQSVEIEGKPNLSHRLEVVDKGGEQSGWVGSNASSILSGGGTVEVPLVMKGGMVSTFNDYLRFLMMLRNFGELDGVRVLRKETVQLMICNHVPVACTGKRNVFVFDKPGLGFSCLGSIQAENPKKDKGAISGEFGWGGLAGPAWTIDPRSDLIILSMTQTAFVLDHEEYLRYAARRAIHQHYYGCVAAPAKATSVSPEIFDVVPPKKDMLPEDQAAALEKEFEEEHRDAKNRIRGAKECAIRPGPRLDRHPSDEEKDADNGEEVTVETSSKRRRASLGGPLGNGMATAAVEAGIFSATPASSSSRRVQASPAPSPTSRASGARMGTSPQHQDQNLPPSNSTGKDKDIISASSPDDKNGLLFSRVSLRSDEEPTLKKARVTAVEGDALEVVTEGNWSTMNVKIGDVSVIDESHFGIATAKTAGPTDFGFLMGGEVRKS